MENVRLNGPATWKISNTMQMLSWLAPLLYKSLDKAIYKLESQLIKKKEKMKNKLHRKNNKPVILDPDNAWTDYEEDHFPLKEGWEKAS